VVRVKQKTSGPERGNWHAAAADRASAAADRRIAAADRRHAAQMLATAGRDELTGALTRRAGNEFLVADIQHAHRTNSALSVVFVDVDGLKLTNDMYGHSQGDALLHAVVLALRLSLRSYDRVIRYGGDEFVCVLPGGDAEVATAGIDRARRQLATNYPGASFSIGVADLLPGESPNELVRRADAALYAARAAESRCAPRTAGVGSSRTPTAANARSSSTDIGCGVCGARIPLTDFVLLDDARATRWADCAGCGETTIIRLASALALSGWS
jgi:diguanylate cyclase (GGDEF)-like protein